MKKSIVIVTLITMSACAFQLSNAQSATATQSLNLAVNTVYKIATSGNPGALKITT